jgi:hypothetical protein
VWLTPCPPPPVVTYYTVTDVAVLSKFIEMRRNIRRADKAALSITGTRCKEVMFSVSSASTVLQENNTVPCQSCSLFLVLFYFYCGRDERSRVFCFLFRLFIMLTPCTFSGFLRGRRCKLPEPGGPKGDRGPTMFRMVLCLSLLS